MPGRLADAVAQFRTAVRLRPEFAEAHANLGAAILQSRGRIEEAVAHLETALRLNPALEQARQTLNRARALP
jgi:tetratricopeptide (TPR) repeat protein